MKTDAEKLGHVFRQQIIRHDCYRLRGLDDPQTILDIGGNMGMFSLTARILYPSARIVCLEPHPQTFERLGWNLRFFDVEVHQVALADTPTVGFHQGGDSGSNSTTGEGQVPGMSLDRICTEFEILPNTAFLKCDCEGGERQIIHSHSDSMLLLSFMGAGFEMHYSDGRGQRKWANAVSREEGERWVANMQSHMSDYGFNPRESSYKADRLGGMFTFRRL